jgi:heat shock protein HtpX
MSETGAAGFQITQERSRRSSWILFAGTLILLLGTVHTVALLLGVYHDGDGGFAPSPAPLLVVSALVAVYLAFAYLASTRATLAFAHARPAGPEYHQVQNLLEGVALAAGIPTPRLYVIDDRAPNAFAAGHRPEGAVVAVTTGLVAKLSRRELEGVLAHEVGHIVNRDIRISTFAVLAVATIAAIAEVALRIGFATSGNRRGGHPVILVFALVLYLVAIPAGLLLKAGLSRRREVLADATAVALTRNPTGIRQALEKLEADTTVVRATNAATAHLWVESPSERRGRVGLVGRLMSTHPPLADRIATLRAYEGLDPFERGPVDRSDR